jgi:ABC-2 type transport system ATP-binding protein
LAAVTAIASKDVGLLITQVEHGPQMHGAALLVLLAFAFVAAVVALARGAVGRRRSRRDLVSGPERDRRIDARVPSARRSGVNGDRCGPAAGDSIVAVTGVTKCYGELVAVDQLTFSIERGTVAGFLGPNGAGKTTTLRLLLGLAQPDTGDARVFGRRYAELDQPMRRVGAVLESNDFHPGRSGRDHLRTLALAAEIPPSRVEEVLELVELEPVARRRVRTYSLGMRQRLGLAGALLGDPELLILDEPANGLDPAGVHWLRTFLRGFAAQGGTVLVSSHLLAEVAQTVDRVVIINRGRLVAAGRLDELADGGQTLEAAFLQLTAGVAP